MLFFLIGLRGWRLFVAGGVMWIPVFVFLAPLFRSMLPARLEDYCPLPAGSPLRENLISIFPDDTPSSPREPNLELTEVEKKPKNQSVVKEPL
jgi:hypothetical protein